MTRYANPIRWEYRPAPYASIAELNRLGAEGWELVAVDGGIAYLKRQVR